MSPLANAKVTQGQLGSWYPSEAEPGTGFSLSLDLSFMAEDTSWDPQLTAELLGHRGKQSSEQQKAACVSSLSGTSYRACL